MANGVAGILFLTSATLQYNDPDPALWLAVYAAAGIVCFFPGRRATGVVAGLVGTVALIWAGTLAPAALEDLVVTDLVKPMRDKTPQIELGREFLGLLLIAGWMAVLAVVEIRRRP